ncbi:MAG TPA: hypothetical protein VMI94_23170 [Bryobacteraceae bacterium]|nr:hypothetical protein [Bryobacteraceae bacterium]
MNRWIGLVLFILLGFLFLAANRSARRGFFAGDELDSIGWTPQVPLATFARELVSPVYNRRNFRPVGHLYFRVMSRGFGLHFADYVWPLHVLHLLNAWLLWLVLRRLGVSPYAATAGALFFGFHMAVFDVYWKPMYVFDLLCATFSLASLLCWIERRWLLAFVAFWLAYKSKELAVMLPAVLAAYEYWIGPRRWRPLIPFCAASLAFGLQGVILNPNTDNDYAFRFTPGAVLASVRFYAAALCGVPSLGLALLPLPAISRDRRLWLGASTTALFFVPLIFLPGRLYSAYWYLPLTGLAIVLASLANGRAGWIVAVFLAAWLPANYLALRDYGPRKLRADAPVRAYVQQLETAAPALRHTSVFLYRNLPSALPPWGVGGALRFLLPAIEVGVYPLEAPPAAVFQRDSSVAMLTWDETSRNLWITPEATYIAMNELTPVWQLTSGWYALEKGFRWTAPWATARLYRAPIARQFEVVLNVGPQALLAQGYTESSVWLDGMRLGTIRSTAPGIRTARWPIPRGSAGSAAIEFRTTPPSQSPRDPRVLGAAVISFGFLPSGR